MLSAACVNTVTRGHLQEDETISNIKAGTTTRAEVAKQLGSPSSESSFGNRTWYYISMVKQSRAVWNQKVTEEHTLEIAFDTNDVVSSVKEYTLTDGKQIELVKRTTPSEGQQLGFFEQIFANLGRFNKKDDATSNNHGRGTPSPTGYPGR